MLKNLTPGTYGAELEGVAAGDVLELPGTSVSSASFGTNSMVITTSAGTYDFTNVQYQTVNGFQTVTGYTATHDESTGLEAITLTGPDIFEANVAATSGVLKGDYLWSNAANWSTGAVPGNGDSVVVDSTQQSVDDLASLNLTSLDLTLVDFGVSSVLVTGASLNVASVEVTYQSGPYSTTGLEADATESGAPVTVTAGAITGGGTYTANGAGATFIDQSAVDDGGQTYEAANGGLFELDPALSSNSILYYSGTASTIALENPGASNAAYLQNVNIGDVLELPGTSVSNVTIGALNPNTGYSSLSVTTNAGTYAFSEVEYATAITGYTAAYDASTGLEAITFTGTDTFKPNAAATSGALKGDYLWSNAANWTTGTVPVNGDSVTFSNGYGVDDLASLSLASLTLQQLFDEPLLVTGASLNVNTVLGSTYIQSAANLEADAADSGAPVTVTVGTITGSFGEFTADGAGATFTVQSVTGPNGFEAENGGLVELSGPLTGDAAFLDYSGTASTIALENPGASNAAYLQNVNIGDVLELPGTSVSNVTIGALNPNTGYSSLSVTTNAGTYAFSEVEYATAITGYTAAYDASTGLEAITFNDDQTPCYCPGTLIATEYGDVPVEELAIGDRVLTHSGEMRPVKWIGKRSYGGRFIMGRSDVLPICIKAGALEDNIPRHDLWISPHHAMYLDGILVEAKDLVNGMTITQAARVESVSYFHVELDTHDVILAEGAWAESFLDDDNRCMFHNARDYAALYPDEQQWPARYCAPRLDQGFELEKIRVSVNTRACLDRTLVC